VARKLQIHHELLNYLVKGTYLILGGAQLYGQDLCYLASIFDTKSYVHDYLLF